MKLFKVAKESEPVTDARIAFCREKGGFRFIFNYFLSSKISAKRKIRVRVRFKPFKIFTSVTDYIEGYSFYEDPVSNLSGYLKEEDICKDAGICIWGDTELKSVRINKK